MTEKPLPLNIMIDNPTPLDLAILRRDATETRTSGAPVG